ncbi:MAG TPA: iron donor protein CyaY [Candidatus Binataceae bacterium]
MDAAEFATLTDQCLGLVAKWLEELDPDEVDYSTADGVVTIEFPDGSRFILSRQSATDQIWLAADAHGWHYTWDAARHQWRDDKDGHELYSRLAEVVGEKVGHPVTFQVGRPG